MSQKPNASHEDQNDEEALEDLLYETRFLLNVLVDLLVEKKIINETELKAQYEKVLAEAEQE
jgi:hypothetical protein